VRIEREEHDLVERACIFQSVQGLSRGGMPVTHGHYRDRIDVRRKRVQQANALALGERGDGRAPADLRVTSDDRFRAARRNQLRDGRAQQAQRTKRDNVGIEKQIQQERLNGIELYIARDKLPATEENEYYHADLIGLAAVTSANEPLGRVIAIHNFGAGDIIEIAPPQGATMLLPFTNAVVPSVDLKSGRVVIELPKEIDGDSPSGVDA